MSPSTLHRVPTTVVLVSYFRSPCWRGTAARASPKKFCAPPYDCAERPISWMLSSIDLGLSNIKFILVLVAILIVQSPTRFMVVSPYIMCRLPGRPVCPIVACETSSCGVKAVNELWSILPMLNCLSRAIGRTWREFSTMMCGCGTNWLR
jgi:hypothetical protein